MATTVSFYKDFIKNMGLGYIKLGSDVFKAALVNAYDFDEDDETYDDLTGQLLTGNGYTAPGITLDNVTWTVASGITRWDCDDINITASGGSIGPFTGLVIYSDTSTSPDDRLVLYFDFGEEITILNGSNFIITFDSTGIASFE